MNRRTSEAAAPGFSLPTIDGRLSMLDALELDDERLHALADAAFSSIIEQRVARNL
jgi:hypothetical protein